MKKLYILFIIFIPYISFAQWTTSGTNIYNTNSGYVGIGATNPQSKMQIFAGNGTGIIDGLSIYGTGGASPRLYLAGGNEYNNYAATFTYNSVTANLDIAPRSGYSTIFTNGNVGIGATNPQSKMQIFAGNGAGVIDGLSIFGTGGASPRLYLAGGNEYNSYAASLTYNSASGNLDIAPRSGYSTIFATGNVGIGTISPDYKLTVNGKIKAEEVQVVVDVPADYVFEKDYSLMPLTEVEKFVTENKHLPGMPDAQSLIANGWQVGEMNNKLLEKVEELTLYIIEQNKRIETLEKKLSNSIKN